MTGIGQFVLDACVFIEAARRYYAFDIAPKFWDSLIAEAENGKVCSIDRVFQELKQGGDELSDWAKKRFRKWFFSTAQTPVIKQYCHVMKWVENNQQFEAVAKRQFAEGADGWVVAYALVHKSVVVTQETPRPDIKRKVPIPNVCQQFQVQHIDTFAMMRKLGIVFR